MAEPSNVTSDYIPPQSEVEKYDATPLSDVQQVLVDYRALNGYIFDPNQLNDSGSDFKFRKMPVSELAEKLNVNPKTLYDWQAKIPNFWGKVAERRIVLSGQTRLAMIHERWYVKALEMKNWAITEGWLRNFDPMYKESKSKMEVEAGASLVKLLDKKRTTPIEGEVVDGTVETN